MGGWGRGGGKEEGGERGISGRGEEGKGEIDGEKWRRVEIERQEMIDSKEEGEVWGD